MTISKELPVPYDSSGCAHVEKRAPRIDVPMEFVMGLTLDISELAARRAAATGLKPFYRFV